MYLKTTTVKKTKTFKSIEPLNDDFFPETIELSRHKINTLYKTEKDVIIQEGQGIVQLIIGESDQISQLNRYILDGAIHVYKGSYLNLLAVSGECSYKVQSYQQVPTIVYLKHSIFAQEIKENFYIPQIYAYYYQVKKAPYYYPLEKHPYCEMTIVETGEFQTVVDDKEYTLTQNEVIVYGPNQLHYQQIQNGTATYYTIVFDMNPALDILMNRVLFLTVRSRQLLEQIIQNSEVNDEYTKQLLVSQLKQLIFCLVIDNETKTKEVIPSVMQRRYEDKLLNNIIDYIHQNIYSAFTVRDLCNHFSISRALIQSLFNKHLNTTPKIYINEVKLKRSLVLLTESQYNITQIATMLGYSSIHYFSRAFKAKYDISPSAYAQKLVKK